MGNCCDNERYIDPKVERAKSIDDIIHHLRSQMGELEVESEKIEESLRNPSKKHADYKVYSFVC